MAQEGTIRTLNLVERGVIATGGCEIGDSLSKEETVVFGETACKTESVSRSESVIITNV